MPKNGERVSFYYLAIILLSFNFRAPFVSMGALLDIVQNALHTDATVMGIIGALPALVSAAVSPFAPRLARKYGLETIIISGTALIAIGSIIRAMFANVYTIMLGTILLSAGIAIDLVLILVAVRRDHPTRISRMTVTEMFSLSIMAALTASINVPLAHALGWQFALGIWSLIAIPPIFLWIKIKNTTHEGIPKQVSHSDVNLFKSKLAWIISAYLGFQSLVFFSFLNWLPTIVIAKGGSTDEANLGYTLFQFIGIPVLLIMDFLNRFSIPMERLLTGASIILFLGVFGVTIGPPQYAWIYSALIGAGCVSTVTLVLMIISERGRHAGESAALSGMSQTIGFLVASAGPFISGWLLESTKNWDIPLISLSVISGLLVLLAWFVGRPGDL